MSVLSRAIPCVALGVLAAAGYGHVGLAHAAAPQAPNAPAVTAVAGSATSPRALLNDYCVGCHTRS